MKRVIRRSAVAAAAALSLVGAGLSAGVGVVGAAASPVQAEASAPVQTESPQAAARPSKQPKAAYGGTPPMWVVHPFITRVGDRAEIRAQVFVDPFRRPGAAVAANRHLSATPDKLFLEVTVAKNKFANPKVNRPINLLPSRDILVKAVAMKRVSKPGLVNLRVRLGARESKQLLSRTYAERRASVGIAVSHWKDTFEAQAGSAQWGMKQQNDASLQRKRASSGEEKAFLTLAKTQVRVDRHRIPVVPKKGARSATGSQSPMYNYVYFTNSTPFEQQIQFNPNVQCMWTGSGVQYPAAQVATVPAGGILQLTYIIEPSPYSGSGGAIWAGLQGATTGMTAPGTSMPTTKNLVNAATATGQSLLESIKNPESYIKPGIGAAAAVGKASLVFLLKFISSEINSAPCSENAAEFPETFAVSTTVTGFGSSGGTSAWGTSTSPVTYSNPGTWAVTQPIPAPQDPQYWVSGANTSASTVDGQTCVGAQTASGQTCYWTGPTTVGSQNASMATTTCPAPSEAVTPSLWCAFVYEGLQPMLGAQTVANYYWNGGQPSYMVSNNEAAGSLLGGSASFQGGLFQNVGPNPGLPGDAWCYGGGLIGVSNCSWLNSSNAGYVRNYNPMGAMNIELTYLTTPSYTSGMFAALGPDQTGTPTPDVVVTPGVSPSGVSGLNVTCDVSRIQGYLSLPFGPNGSATSQISSSNLVTEPINAAGDTATGGWSVNFFGLDSNGNYVYYNANPGTVPADQSAQSATSSTIYSLGPNLPNVYIPFNANNVNQSANGFLPNTVLGNMQTAQNMNTAGNTDTAVLSAVGCSAVPTATLAGLDITGTVTGVAQNFGQINSAGNGWPMPGNHTGWPANLYPAYSSYLNYSWQTPVKQVNVAFQGVPVSAATAVICTTSSCHAGS